MIPSLEQCRDLQASVKILATAVAYLIKSKVGITGLLKATATTYDILEKKFLQAIKGVKYESRSQCKCKEEQLVTPDQFKDDDDDDESSSSSDNEVQAKAPKHKKHKK